MASRTILNVFEQYERARLNFVQTVSDLAIRATNVQCLISAKAIAILSSLLKDTNNSVVQLATLGLARLAGHSEKVALSIVNADIVQVMLQSADNHLVHYKRAVLLALRSIAKHGTQLATMVQHCGGLEYAIGRLEDFDITVKESAMACIAHMAKHSPELARAIVDQGAVPLIVLNLQQPELCLKQSAAMALSEIAKHSPSLAANIAESGTILFLSKCLANQDNKLKRCVLSTLAQIASHSQQLAEACVEAEVFPVALHLLMSEDRLIRVNAADLVRQIVKHSVELAQLVVNSGACGPLIELTALPDPDVQVAVLTAIGYIAGQSEQLALSLIAAKVVTVIAAVIADEQPDRVLTAAVWALSHIGKHTPEHCNHIALAGIFPRLVELHIKGSSSEDLQNKCKCALKLCLQKCLHLPALEPLLYDSPPSILKYILGQYSKILPHDQRARRLFVTTGGLKKVQEIPAEPGSTLMEYIANINACFPEEVIRYLTPGYAENLLAQVEEFTPKIPPIFMEEKGSDICNEFMLQNQDGQEEQIPEEVKSPANNAKRKSKGKKT